MQRACGLWVWWRASSRQGGECMKSSDLPHCPLAQTFCTSISWPGQCEIPRGRTLRARHTGRHRQAICQWYRIATTRSTARSAMRIRSLVFSSQGNCYAQIRGSDLQQGHHCSTGTWHSANSDIPGGCGGRYASAHQCLQHAVARFRLLVEWWPDRRYPLRPAMRFRLLAECPERWCSQHLAARLRLLVGPQHPAVRLRLLVG